MTDPLRIWGLGRCGLLLCVSQTRGATSAWSQPAWGQVGVGETQGAGPPRPRAGRGPSPGQRQEEKMEPGGLPPERSCPRVGSGDPHQPTTLDLP